MGSLQRELKQLSEAGIIIRTEIGRQAFFKAKISKKQHFIKSVLNSPKIFIIGDQNELDELAR
jgi:Fe2+ or Zn2+ uptake regulation protein